MISDEQTQIIIRFCMANSVNTDFKLKSPPFPTPQERVLSEFSNTNLSPKYKS